MCSESSLILCCKARRNLRHHQHMILLRVDVYSNNIHRGHTAMCARPLHCGPAVLLFHSLPQSPQELAPTKKGQALYISCIIYVHCLVWPARIRDPHHLTPPHPTPPHPCSSRCPHSPQLVIQSCSCRPVSRVWDVHCIHVCRHTARACTQPRTRKLKPADAFTKCQASVSTDHCAAPCQLKQMHKKLNTIGTHQIWHAMKTNLRATRA